MSGGAMSLQSPVVISPRRNRRAASYHLLMPPEPSSSPADRPHDLNPTGRFSDRADDYRRYRPSYPSDAIDAILEGLAAGSLVAADIGAGTGIASVLLAGRGVRVLAVEPNPAMRSAAPAHPRIEWIDGSAEATTLAGASVGLVLCAQAYHWFRPAEALVEFSRILVPHGRAALMWNDRDDADPLTAAYGDAIRDAADKDPGFFDHTRAETFMSSGLFRGQRRLVFPSAQPLDRAGLIGRALSASYIPKAGARHDRLLSALSALHAAFADTRGDVHLRYHTQVFLAEKA